MLATIRMHYLPLIITHKDSTIIKEFIHGPHASLFGRRVSTSLNDSNQLIQDYSQSQDYNGLPKDHSLYNSSSLCTSTAGIQAVDLCKIFKFENINATIELTRLT